MRKFVLKTSIVALLVFLFLAAVEATVRRIPNDYSEKAAYLRTNITDIEILILGSSFENYGIHPDLFHRQAYNAAIPGQTVEVDYAICQRYLDSCLALKVLILPFDIPSLFQTKQNVSYYRYEYHHCFQLDVSNFSMCDRLAYLAYTPRKASLMAMYKWVCPTYERITSDSHGWRRDTLSFTNLPIPQQKEYIRQIAYDFNLISKTYHPTSSIPLYEETIQHCLRDNIHVILLTSPQHAALVAQLDTTVVYHLINSGLTMENRYPNVTYINLLSTPLFPDSLFCDGDHLNVRGATKLTLILDSIIESQTTNWETLSVWDRTN